MSSDQGDLRCMTCKNAIRFAFMSCVQPEHAMRQTVIGGQRYKTVPSFGDAFS